MLPIKSRQTGTYSIAIETFEKFHPSDLIEDLYVVLNHVFVPPSTFYVEHKMISNQSACIELEQYFPKALALFIERHLFKLGRTLKIPKDASGGWEFWSRVSTNGSPSFGYLHVDNDEYLRSKSCKLVTPIYGSILYLGPAQGMEGGETAFLIVNGDKAGLSFFSTLSKSKFTVPEFTLIPPTAGLVATFDGSTPHAVMWAKLDPAFPRVTFLANYWNKRLSSVPTGICTMTPSEFKGEVCS